MKKLMLLSIFILAFTATQAQDMAIGTWVNPNPDNSYVPITLTQYREYKSLLNASPCIVFKLAGANVTGQTYNATGDSIVFTYSIVSYIEKVGLGNGYEKVETSTFALPLPYGLNSVQLQDVADKKGAEYISKNHPNIY